MLDKIAALLEVMNTGQKAHVSRFALCKKKNVYKSNSTASANIPFVLTFVIRFEITLWLGSNHNVHAYYVSTLHHLANCKPENMTELILTRRA
jgi:hypothetical protein